MIKAVLIDDERHCIDTLSIIIGKHCPEIKIIATFQSAADAIAAVHDIKPDVLFLDVEMPSMNGFEMLERIGPVSFAIIFTTGYDQYAIKAIRFSALDYLLKPVDPNELEAAVRKVVLQKSRPNPEQIHMLMTRYAMRDKSFNKIAIPTSDGYELLPVDQVLFCEADNNYSHIHLKNKHKVTACRTLKEMEEQLSEFPSFMRVHHSYIVNLTEVVKYLKGEGGYLVMSDGTTVNVSRSRKDALLKLF
jgi:two-component system LytT family response regulator